MNSELESVMKELELEDNRQREKNMSAEVRNRYITRDTTISFTSSSFVPSQDYCRNWYISWLFNPLVGISCA
jgi:hypothetical protein